MLRGNGTRKLSDPFAKLEMAKRKTRNAKGAAAIEFALMAPVFLLIVFMILELAVFEFAKASLRYAINKAARTVQTGQAQQAADTNAYLTNVICTNYILDCANIQLNVSNFRTLEDISLLSPTFDADGVVTNLEVSPGGNSTTNVITGILTFNFTVPMTKAVLQPDGNPIIIKHHQIRKNEPFDDS